jgi:diaminopimelate epimerase
MPTLSFTKMNGAGNDFVLLDNRDGSLALTDAQIARLCDRHRGVGADGLLLVEKPEAKADFRMRYYNADGREAEMCGNGARCFARFVSKIAPANNGTVSFETPAGVISATLHGDQVSLAMSQPGPFADGVELDAAGQKLAIDGGKKEWGGSAFGCGPGHSMNLNMIGVPVTTIAVIGDQEHSVFLGENGNEVIGRSIDLGGTERAGRP